MDLVNSMFIAGSGMRAQSARLRIIAQNIANADAVGRSPGEAPYRRKVISFKNVLDRELGTELVTVSKFGVDKSPFGLKFDPGHPAANEQGYILTPNVNSIIENTDMKEARRGYEANLNMIEVTKTMVQQTISLLRN